MDTDWRNVSMQLVNRDGVFDRWLCDPAANAGIGCQCFKQFSFIIMGNNQWAISTLMCKPEWNWRIQGKSNYKFFDFFFCLLACFFSSLKICIIRNGCGVSRRFFRFIIIIKMDKWLIRQSDGNATAAVNQIRKYAMKNGESNSRLLRSSAQPKCQ